ncbi:MAG: polysaccharide biosynthesis/export family protein [Muribaculaceae bacterium]|nr:polysaccharide biosynthesis/export family protein [Muribaculaceae bacterium]
MNVLYRTLLAITIMVAFASCHSSKNVVYFQDLPTAQQETMLNINKMKVQPGDNLSIVVTCRDPKLSALYNLLQPNSRLMAGSDTPTSNGDMMGYTVDSKGNIDFPQLGEIHVGGLTREEIAAEIKNRLIRSAQVKDAVVSVEFNNLYVSVMGEVNKPGRYSVKQDELTVLDALSEAGDLTIYGKRDQVYVIREQDGKRVTYVMDLRSKDMFDSPAYFLQQGDVVYVAPNNTRAGQASINDNSFKSASFWMSLASLLTTVAVLIFK